MVKKAEGFFARDQRRYFTLAFGCQTRNLKLSYYSDLTEGVPTGRKGHIALSLATVFKPKDAQLVVVRDLVIAVRDAR